MSGPARVSVGPTIDRQKLAEWSQTLFKGTAYLTLFLLDYVAVDAIAKDLAGITLGGWFAIFWLGVANVFMFPKITSGVFAAIGIVFVIGLLIGALVLFSVTAHWWWSPTVGLIIAGVYFGYMLFAKLDAINANLVRANELKRRELKKIRKAES
jgi:hypothetical protein